MVVSRKGLVYDESLLLCVNTGRISETNMDMNIVINGYFGNQNICGQGITRHERLIL